MADNSNHTISRDSAPIKSVSSFVATIYVGLKRHYDGEVLDRSVALAAIQAHVDAVGMCVTVTDTLFVYTNRNEPGLAVGFINYPRFPPTPEAITEKVVALAGILMRVCHQWKVSVVLPDRTIMLENPNEI